MKKIEKILVPTDFSESAENAFCYAIELAKVTKASIVLYHVFKPFESAFTTQSQADADNQQHTTEMLQALQEMKETFGKNAEHISLHIDKGAEESSLLQYCRQHHIDWMVMGTTGASGIKEVAVGSFTAHMMRNADVPVLAVPDNYTFSMPSKITFATDYNSKDLQALTYLNSWNNAYFGATIQLLHIDKYEKDKDAQEKALQQFREKVTHHLGASGNITFRHEPGDHITQALLQITLNDKTDILVVKPEKREGWWNKLFQKSITEGTAHHVHIPLLSIPEND